MNSSRYKLYVSYDTEGLINFILKLNGSDDKFKGQIKIPDIDICQEIFSLISQNKYSAHRNEGQCDNVIISFSEFTKPTIKFKVYLFKEYVEDT